MRSSILVPVLATLSLAASLAQDEAASSSSTIRELDPKKFLELGSKRVEVSYGTYAVTARSKDDGMSHFKTAIAPPCTECLITFMQAQLQYMNGTRADAETGMWLHHVVFYNRARNDTVCPSSKQRFFASGNERSPIDLTVGLKPWVGYPLHDHDDLFAFGELMNMMEDAAEVLFSMVWEYIPSIPAHFEQALPVWLDVTGCGGSEVPAKPHEVFTYSSPPVKSDFNGNAVLIAGHVHDGGTHIDVVRNDLVICQTQASYRDDTSSAHIDTIDTCINAGRISKGDEWSITAHYDTTLHAPMASNEGSLEPVMGIALAYVTLGDPMNIHGLHGTSLVLLIVGVIMAVGLLGLWYVRQRTEKQRSSWTPRKHQGWQRVQSYEIGDDETEAEDDHLLERHEDEA